MTNATAVSTKLDVTRAVQRLYNDWHDEAGFKFSWELATCDFVKKNPLASCRRFFCCLCMLAMHVNAAGFMCQLLLSKQGRFERSPFLFGEGLELRFADFGEAVVFVPVCNEMFATVDDCMATCDDFYYENTSL
jgi:hypothetical protein